MWKTSPAIGNLLWDGLLHTRFLPAAFSAGSKAICCIPPRQAHPIFCTQSCKKVVKRTEKFASSADNQRLLNFKDLVLTLLNIWSFLRFQPGFWLNTAVFLHTRF